MIVFVSSCPVAIDFKLKIKLIRTNKFKGKKVGSSKVRIDDFRA